MNTYSWDTYFMTLAYTVSMKSKDPSTKVGAVIAGEEKEIIACGYNGLPRRIGDTASRYSDKQYKYMVSNHAEENAILHCSKIGVSPKGCSLYVPWMPCAACAKIIIQVGIKEVVCDANFPGNDVDRQYKFWQESMKISKEMFKESGVKLRFYNGALIKAKGLYQEKEFDINFC